jgi:large subunit ribosomal protein L21
MFAIVEIQGKQYRITPQQKIIVDKQNHDVGAKVIFKNVLLINNGSEVVFGQPAISTASVEAEVIKNFKGDKVIAFKKRRRQNSRRKRGHRQQHTLLQITAINN